MSKLLGLERGRSKYDSPSCSTIWRLRSACVVITPPPRRSVPPITADTRPGRSSPRHFFDIFSTGGAMSVGADVFEPLVGDVRASLERARRNAAVATEGRVVV